MIIANDATVKAGSFFPMTVKKTLRAQRIDQVDEREAVTEGDALGAQRLLDGHREEGTGLDGRVVGVDHGLAPRDLAGPGDDAGRRRPAPLLVHLEGRKQTELEELASRIDELRDPLARREPAFGVLLLDVVLPAAQNDRRLVAAVGLDQVEPGLAARAPGCPTTPGITGFNETQSPGKVGCPRPQRSREH